MGFWSRLSGKKSQRTQGTCSKCGSVYAEFSDRGPDVIQVMTVEQAQRKAYWCSNCQKDFCGKCCNVRAGRCFPDMSSL